VYCSGPSGQFYRKAGVKWEAFNTGLAGDLYAIGGSGPENLYTLGEKGVVFHRSGGVWSEMQSPTNVNLVDVLWIPSGVTYFCGWKGKFFCLTDGGWDDYSLGKTETNLYRMALFRGRIYVGSDEEGLLRLEVPDLMHFAPNVRSIGVRVVGERLYAYGGTTIQSFDGAVWQKIDLDLARIVPFAV
jgi:hypothetical protein